MRFLKIFLVSFFSLIGTVGAILGIMYLAGSFNKPVVDPTEIHFEQSEYFVDGDFTVTIMSSTPDVTKKAVTLSLRAQDGEAVDGYITDGVIKIPENVTLGEPFVVSLITAFNEEVGAKWIRGGISQIFASSESDKAIDVSCTVNVDVPVYSLAINTFTNNTAQTLQNSFALGESFFAEAVFVPAQSKFKYSGTSIKKVHFDTSFNPNGYIEENSAMIEDMAENNKSNIYGYNVIKTTNTSQPSVGIKARVFQTAVIEDKYAELNLSEDDIINYLKNPDYGITGDKSLVFTNRTVSNFAIGVNANSQTFSIPTNQISQIYANASDLSLPSLKINISASDNTSLQGKLADVGLRILVRDNASYREANANEMFFADNTPFEFAENANGAGLYYKVENEYVLISSVVSERYVKAGEVFNPNPTGNYFKDNDDFVLISSVYGQTYDKYYLPTIVSSNVDNSFWNIVAMSENLTVFFETYLFENQDIIQTDNIVLQTYNTLLSYKTAPIVSTNISWKNEEDITLTFIDNAIDEKKVYPEYNLKDNLEFSNANATYSFVKFFVYTTEQNLNLPDIIFNITEAQKISLAQFNITQTLFEVNGDIIRVQGAGSFNVVAVILKTDYKGHLIENNGLNEIYKISTPKGTSLNSYQALNIQVNKTLQDLSAQIDVYDKSKLMNAPKLPSQTISHLAFLHNQDLAPIFKVNIVITADQRTNITDEIDLFVSAWNDGKIKLQGYTQSGQISNLLYFQQNIIVDRDSGTQSGNIWVLPIEVYSLETIQDTTLYIKLIYEQTESYVNEIFVNNALLPQEIVNSATFSGDFIPVEIYDGKASLAEFNLSTSTEYPVVKTVSLTKGNQIGINSFEAQSVGISYIQDDKDVTNTIVNENGEFKVVFTDKFGNEITLNPEDYSISNMPSSTNKILKVLDYSSSLYEEQQPTSILYLTEQNIGSLVSLEYNEGQVFEGVMQDKFVDVKDEYLENNNKILQITRYGATGAKIDLLGESGLLDIVYEVSEQNAVISYQLYNIIEYNFASASWQETYADFLALSPDGKSINILKTIGTAIKFNISANTGLGYVIQIELTIEPNISTTYEIVTEQEGASDFVENNRYYGIYSDNDVSIKITFNLTLIETVAIGYVANAETNFYFEGGDTIFYINNELVAEAVLICEYTARELGKQVIKIQSGASSYDFSREINLYVNPNLTLANAEDNILAKSVVISALETEYNVITSSDYIRVVGNKAISPFDVQITVAEVFDGETSTPQVYVINIDGSKTLTQNIFSCNGFTISANQSLNGSYFVILDVKYGEFAVGQVYVEINSNITPNLEDASSQKMFSNYNGTLHLTLISNQSYSLENIKALFNNASFAKFNPASVENVYSTNSIVESSITVSSLTQAYSGYYLQVSNNVGSIVFPVLFSNIEISSVQYNIENAINKELTEKVNGDISYMQDNPVGAKFLIENDIYDVIDSGKTSSINQKNYELSIQDDIFTIKNLLPQDVTLLAYASGNYYAKTLKAINVQALSYKFSVENIITNLENVEIVSSDWTLIADVSAIADEYKTSENAFIGVFNSEEEFNSETFIKENKGYGIAGEFFNNIAYDIRVFDEINGEIDFANPTISTNAVIDSTTALLTTKSSTENKIVWVVVMKNQTILASYRVLIVANSALNIYYPYLSAPINNQSELNGEEGEYVNFAQNENIVISFNENIPSNMPASALGENIKRIMLQYGNSNIGFTNAENYSLIIVIDKISVNGVMSSNPETISNFASFQSGVNKLTIKNTKDILVIYLKAYVSLNGALADTTGITYKIFVNHQAENLELFLKNQSGQLTNDKPSTQKQTIPYGQTYDFSNVVLTNTIASSQNPVDGLDYFIYSTTGKDLSQYFNLDKENKTLSILPDVQIVSDEEIRFVYFSSYGALLEVPLLFKSSINLEFNNLQDEVEYDSLLNKYSVYTDTLFSLNAIFTLKNGETALGAGSDFWVYSIDGGENFISGENIIFPQNKTGEYDIIVKVMLSSFDSETYLDDYVFEIKLNVVGNLISCFPAPNALPVGEGAQNKIEYPTASDGVITLSDIIYVEADSASNQHLFSVHNENILADFSARISGIRGNEYINSLTLNLLTNQIEIGFNSPAEPVEILIEVILEKDEFSIVSRLTFVLTPDMFVEAQYPVANSSHEVEFEAVYLNGEYYNNKNDNSGTSSKGSVKLRLNGEGYFGTKRLVVTDSEGTSLNAVGETGARITLAVASQTSNIVVSASKNGTTYLNGNINIEAGVSVVDELKIQWVGTTAMLTNMTASLVLNIYVDGIQREVYAITFYSQLADIFSVTTSAHNQTKLYDGSEKEYEVFFVENNSTGKLFAHSDALLTFKLRESYTLSLSGETETWKFYNGNTYSENALIGEIKVKSSDSVMKVALSGEQDITLENVMVKIGENEYSFNLLDQNNVYAKFVDSSSQTEISYRAKASFMGEELSYDKFAKYIQFENRTAGDFTLNLNNEDAINAPARIAIKVGDVEFSEYNYTLLYDFHADETMNADNSQINITAGEEINEQGGLETFGITRLDGTNFTQEYFIKNNVELNARIILVTDSLYPTTKSTDNIKYINNEYISYYNANLKDLGAEFYTFADYASISLKTIKVSESEAPVYDFAIRAVGAENSGNYVYILVTFSAEGVTSSLAYAVVKVFISPAWVVQLFNDTNSSVNAIDNPLEIMYDSELSNKITQIELASKNANLIRIYKGQDTSTNYAVEGNFSYVIKDEIGGYVKLNSSYGDSSNFYKDVIALENTTNTAQFGEKVGYIEIKDKYGFVSYYYLRLTPQDEDALSLNSILGTTHYEIYEGSSISIEDSTYTAPSEMPTDYIFKINNLSKLPNTITYSASFAIDGVVVENQNNVGKISVQKQSFYGDSNKTAVNLKISISLSGTLNGSAYSEVVVINITLNLLQRYSVSSLSSSYIREGQNFNVSDYLYVRDETTNANVGNIELSNLAFTLVANENLRGASIGVGVKTGQTNTTPISITNVGYDLNGGALDSTYGNYYYPLNLFEGYQNAVFSNHTFTINSITLPSNSGYALLPHITYNIGESASISTTDYSFFNSETEEETVSLVYKADNGNYYYKNYGNSTRAMTINTSTITSSWQIDSTTSFPSQGTGFVGVYNSDRTSLLASISSINYASSVKLIEDKVLKVVTLDAGDNSAINVALNNKTHRVEIPFALDKDGVKTVSIYEAILSLPSVSGNTSSPLLNNLDLYEKDKNAVSSTDMQKLKGIMVYNDTLTLSVAGGNKNTNVIIRVYFENQHGNEDMAEKTFIITNNNPHYFYASISSILGENYGLNVDVSYKIEVIFTLTQIFAGEEYSRANAIVPSGIASSLEYEYDNNNSVCTYVYTIEEFEISEMPIQNNVYSDKIDILHASEFVNKVKSNVQKYYLVRYMKDNVVYNVSVNYNVTPKYYAIDASGVLQGGNSYNVIYLDQVTSLDQNIYEISFENWAGNYVLDDANGNDIIRLTEASSDLYFEIQTTDASLNATSSGAAILLSDNTIRTTSIFDAEQHYIKVSVFTYVNSQQEQKVYIGDIFLKLDLTSVSVPVSGTYNIKINSPQISGLNYTINTPYDFKSTVVKVTDILKSTNLSALVEENTETNELTLGFYTGSYYSYQNPKDCNFSVVSVISDIYKSEFDNGMLNIKINLNEVQGSIGQRIKLVANALPLTSDGTTPKTSNEFYLTVTYSGGAYYLQYGTTTERVDAIIEKGIDGFHTVSMPLSDIFNETFVGSDYNYNININGIESVETENALSVIYADNVTSAGNNNTMFFQVSYPEGTGVVSKIIGLKNTEENQKLSGPLGYAINVKDLLNGVDLKNCTVAYLGDFDLNCSDNGAYTLLLSYGLTYEIDVYSIAVIESYSNSNPFYVEDYALSMLNFATAIENSPKIEFYAFETAELTYGEVGNETKVLMPTYLEINSNASNSENYYYGFANVDGSSSLVGFKTSSEKIIAKCIYPDEDFNQKDIRIVDCNYYIKEKISDKFSSQTSIATTWQTQVSQSIMLTKTDIEKTSENINGSTIEQYLFKVNPLTLNGAYGNSNQVVASLDLTKILNSPEASSTYFFTIYEKDAETNEDKFLKTLALSGASLSNANISPIVGLVSSAQISSGNGSVFFKPQSINASLQTAGIYNFEFLNVAKNPGLVKAVKLNEVAGTSYLSSDINILEGYASANQIMSNTYSITLKSTQGCSYLSIKNLDGTYANYVAYLSEGDDRRIDVDISNLTTENSVEISLTSLSIKIEDASKAFTLLVSVRDYDQTFNLQVGSEIVQTIVPARASQVEIVVKDYFPSATSVNLVVTPDI